MPPREIYCALCKKNGETEAVYKAHKLKDENNQVTCPVLLQYTCPKCGITGEHTISYCPRKRRENLSEKKGSSHQKLHQTTERKGFPEKRAESTKLLKDFQLPPYCLFGQNLNAFTFPSILQALNFISPNERVPFLYKNGYNLARFQAIQSFILSNRQYLLMMI